ncbi:FAD-dependent oxidoreductase [Microcoleus sp. N3A4]|uniref:FAD-dependent oxidoreductase n=1 Tax=Microcoleus sp. N3A4 TaxID=3055379 RepID=UPI002FD3B853
MDCQMDCQAFKTKLHKNAPDVDVICYYDKAYGKESQIRNARFSYKPYCIVKCGKSSDVVQVVNFCRIKEMSVRIRSGGHHHEGMCSADDVVIIDLSNMKEILPPEVSTSDGATTICIEPGAKLEDINRELGSDGYILPGGGCGTVNVGGLVQGGGWGMLARKGGLTCDALQEVELVLANGNIICASNDNDNEYRDLFWAIKGGGGGNFGIITKYKFNLMKSQSVWLVVLRYSSNDESLLTELLAFYLNKLETFDHNITSFARVSHYDDDKKVERPTFKITFQCLGNDNNAYKAVDDFIQELKDIERNGIIFFKSVDYSPQLSVHQAFSVLNGVLPAPSEAQQNNGEAEWNSRDLGAFTLQPLNKTITPGSSNALNAASFSTTCGGESFLHKVSSAFPKGGTDINNLSQKIIEFIIDNDDFPKAAAYLSIHSLGGEIKTKNPSSSSFFYRDKEFILQFQVWWPEESSSQKDESIQYIQWIENFRSNLDHAGLIEGAFINFADRDIPVPPTSELDNRQTSELDDRLSLLKYYYGENLNQLRETKTKYDPHNFFSFAMSIPTLPGGSNAKRE